MESLCQGKYHKKAPVGTVGFRNDKAGYASMNQTERRVDTLYFVFSESKFLRKVENGELKVNRTKQHRISQLQDVYNYGVWDAATWTGVDIP